jgi:hypothetical protein
MLLRTDNGVSESLFQQVAWLTQILLSTCAKSEDERGFYSSTEDVTRQ